MPAHALLGVPSAAAAACAAAICWRGSDLQQLPGALALRLVMRSSSFLANGGRQRQQPALGAAAAVRGQARSAHFPQQLVCHTATAASAAATEQTRSTINTPLRQARTSSANSSSSSKQAAAQQPPAPPSTSGGSSRRRGTATALPSQPAQQQRDASPAPAPAAARTAAVAAAAPASQHQQPAAAAAPAAVVGPSQLPIADRVQLLRDSAAARQSSSSELQLLECCAVAGLGSAARTLVLDLVARGRLSRRPAVLRVLLAAYSQLAAAYGDDIVLCWLRRAPQIMRDSEEVPSRLAQLQELLGGGPQEEALALTRRCPQVLGVEEALLRARLQGVCELLHLPPDTAAREVLVAAPALLAMAPATLAAKAAQLQELSASHPAWASAFGRLSPTSLAILLTYSMQRQQRLRFVAARGLQAKASMQTIMAAAEAKMQQQHPDYEAWCQQQQQQQQQRASDMASAGLCGAFA